MKLFLATLAATCARPQEQAECDRNAYSCAEERLRAQAQRVPPRGQVRREPDGQPREAHKRHHPQRLHRTEGAGGLLIVPHRILRGDSDG